MSLDYHEGDHLLGVRDYFYGSEYPVAGGLQRSEYRLPVLLGDDTVDSRVAGGQICQGRIGG